MTRRTLIVMSSKEGSVGLAGIGERDFDTPAGRVARDEIFGLGQAVRHRRIALGFSQSEPLAVPVDPAVDLRTRTRIGI
jgi:hypothetical protein